MKYEGIESLERYLRLVEAALLDEARQAAVIYPAQAVLSWNANELVSLNSGLLDAVAKSANLYAIHVAPKGSSDYSLRYIGKTTRALARERVRNHLFKKNEQTGSKLSEVKRHVQAGGSIRMSWLSVEPESLRNYLEEELIRRNRSANWNRENAKSR